MLAKLVADIPPGLLYEPKWDGFRAIVERDGDAVELHSRNGKPMARYFPDLVAAFLRDLPSRCVLDGEIVVIGTSGRLDFFALQQRVHPAASRVDRLAGETPASFIGFDALDDPALPFAERRAALEALPLAPPLFVTPLTDDLALAREWFERFEGAGLDGMIAKDGALAVPARRARDVQGQAPAHAWTASSAATGCTRCTTTRSARSCSGCSRTAKDRPGRARSAAWSRSAPPRPSRWRGGASC